jgi:hypothetical protein
MRIGKYRTVGPTVDTEWGPVPSPYIMSDPTQLRHPWLPPTYRGRHIYRTQPRPLGPLTTGVDSVTPKIGPTTHPAGHALGVEEHQAETKWATYAFLGALGLMGLVLLGKAA